MKLRPSVFALAASSFIFASQALSQAPAPATTPTPAAPAPAPAASNLTDDQIAGIVSAANQGEIDEAKVAVKHTKSSGVKDFANMMIKEHGDVKKDLKKLTKETKLSTSSSDEKKKIEENGKASVVRLKSLKAADFDKAYVDDQVKMHSDLLNTIDTTLLPTAKNDQLKALLTKIRPAVAAHLDKAKALQGSLGSQM